MEPIWKIRLLGGVSAHRRDTRLEHFRTQKTASLLAFLAFPPGRAVSREELIALFWPDDDLPSARHKLSVALHSLRQQLEPEGSAQVLEADRFTVRLRPDQVTTDVQELEAELASAAAGGERAAHLERAVALYHGELLAGFYDPWIFPEQQRLAERFVWALQELVREREARGEQGLALDLALRAVAADPLREEHHQEVMRLQLAAGRPAEAVRQFRLLEQRLRDELDTGPSPAARVLLQQAQEAARAEAPPSPPAHAAKSRPQEEPGGAVPLGSRFYVERETDGQFRAALARRDSIVLVKGPRQVGKTSLLARGLQHARQSGVDVVLTDLQRLNADHFSSADALLQALADELCEQLDLEVSPVETWDARRGPSPNFRRYLRSQVFAGRDRPLVWGLDEVDRLFGCPFSTEVFGLFRSWHNERALDPETPWSRLSLAIAYATEAHLFITDLNQSPFNVGTRLYLADFDRAQVADLNTRHGSPLRAMAEVERLLKLAGGHPYLVRAALHGLASSEVTEPISWLERQADRDEGLFSEHLRRLLLLIRQNPDLAEAVREVLQGRACPSLESFYRLRSAGVFLGEALPEARLRCGLYSRFLKRHFL